MRARLGTLLTLVVVMVAACGSTQNAGPVDAAYPTVSLSTTTPTADLEDAGNSTSTTRSDDVYGGETFAPTTTDSSTPTSAPTTTTIGAVNTTEALTTTTAATTTTTTTLATTTTTAVAGEAQIEIEGFSFGSPLRVTVGTAVTVVNRDSVSHTWTSRGGVFDSGTLAPGDRFTYVFDQPGEFAFFCRIHPSMTGSITVES